MRTAFCFVTAFCSMCAEEMDLPSCVAKPPAASACEEEQRFWPPVSLTPVSYDHTRCSPSQLLVISLPLAPLACTFEGLCISWKDLLLRYLSRALSPSCPSPGSSNVTAPLQPVLSDPQLSRNARGALWWSQKEMTLGEDGWGRNTRWRLWEAGNVQNGCAVGNADVGRLLAACPQQGYGAFGPAPCNYGLLKADTLKYRISAMWTTWMKLNVNLWVSRKGVKKLLDSRLIKRNYLQHQDVETWCKLS